MTREIDTILGHLYLSGKTHWIPKYIEMDGYSFRQLEREIPLDTIKEGGSSQLVRSWNSLPIRQVHPCEIPVPLCSFDELTIDEAVKLPRCITIVFFGRYTDRLYYADWEGNPDAYRVELE